jgi:hypothetical protein
LFPVVFFGRMRRVSLGLTERLAKA